MPRKGNGGRHRMVETILSTPRPTACRFSKGDSLKELYNEYIDYMAPKWTEASVKSERKRLNKLWTVIDGDAQKLWSALGDLGDYTKVTYFGRVSAFWDWQIKKKGLPGPNPYSEFRAENPQCFRGKYVYAGAVQHATPTVQEVR